MSDGSALLTLGAVALGGGIATLAQFSSDWLRDRRARKGRWYGERHAAYARFLAEVLPMVRWLERAVEDPRDPELAAFDMEQWADDFRSVEAEVALVGSKTVIAEVSTTSLLLQARGHLALAWLEYEPHQEEALRHAGNTLDNTLMRTLISEVVNVMRLDLGSPEIDDAFDGWVRLGEALSDDEDDER